MLSCWQEVPESRPTFKSLGNRIGDMLDESVKRHFIALNEPYLYENVLKFSDGKIDYLSMMAVPKNESPALRYINIPSSSSSHGATANEEGENIDVKYTNHRNMTNLSDQMEMSEVTAN